MRWGYLVPDFPTQTHIFFWREIEALRSLGEDVRLISTKRPPASSSRHHFGTSARRETYYLFPPSPSALLHWTSSGRPGLIALKRYLAGLEATNLLSRAKQALLAMGAIELVQWAAQSGISHIHGHSCANSAHVLALCHAIGGPSYSLTLHGDLDVYGVDHQAKMRQASFVCAVGQHLVKQIMTKTEVENVIVTCMGVNTEEMRTLGQQRAYHPGTLHLATVARLHRAKGHVYALAAIDRAREAGLKVHYTIAGDGPDRHEVKAKVKELALERHVTLTGTLSEREVYQLLSQVDAFILPSTGAGEAWPVSIMEAMGAGLPVIASIIGATPEMITSGKDGFLVRQKDEDALFAHMMQLGKDIQLRQNVGAAARITAEKRFDVKMTANVLRQAVHRAVHRAETGSRR